MDEALKPLTTSPELFKRRLAKIMPEVHSLHVQCHERYNGVDGFTFWHVRFFRMTKEFHYENIVHNSPILPKGAKSAATNLVLYHYGYSDPAVMQKKRARSLPLLNKRLKNNPKDYDAMFYKAMIHIGQNEYKEGIKWAEECVKCINEELNGDVSAVLFCGKIYASMGSFFLHHWAKTREQLYADRAFQWISKGLELWPNDLDLNFLMTQLYWCAENPYKVKEYGIKYKEVLQKYRTQEKEPELDTFMSPVDMDNAVLTKRCLHTATKHCEDKIDKMLQEAA
jgi:tetratricopeptide (TPR) repeat protein